MATGAHSTIGSSAKYEVSSIANRRIVDIIPITENKKIKP